MSKRLNLFFVLFLVGSTCHTAALPALVRTPTLMMQPSLDIKPFMSFPVDSSSAVGLFPNFNTVSKCIFMLSVSSSTSSVNSQFVFPKCVIRDHVLHTLLSRVTEDNAALTGVSPHNRQCIYFTRVFTGDFSPVALNSFDRPFSGLSIHIISRMLFTYSRTQFKDRRHIDFSLLV